MFDAVEVVVVVVIGVVSEELLVGGEHFLSLSPDIEDSVLAGS